MQVHLTRAKAKQQMLASIEMSGAPKGQRSVRDILNIMHDMTSTLKDIGISARTAEVRSKAGRLESHATRLARRGPAYYDVDS
jgi:hypothetical protein